MRVSWKLQARWSFPLGVGEYFHLIYFKVEKKNEVVVAHTQRPGTVPVSYTCQGKGQALLTVCGALDSAREAWGTGGANEKLSGFAGLSPL